MAALTDNHHHEHSHAHSSTRAGRGRLRAVLVLTAIYMLAEAFGGWLTGSLALLADAGHMLTDVAALALALLAARFAERPATARKTFGYYRLEILAAFVNGVALVAVSLLILREAYERLQSPTRIDAVPMILIACGGLVVNLICAKLLHAKHEGHAHDLNVRGAMLHVLGDALGSVGAIMAGVAIYFYGWFWADAVFSALICCLIVWSSWSLIRESTNVLLEGTPSHINLARLEQTILTTVGVEDVHDLHVWTITSGRDALSAHVRHAAGASPDELLQTLGRKLRDEFHLDHLTIQMERWDSADDTFHFCRADTACFNSTRPPESGDSSYGS